MLENPKISLYTNSTAVLVLHQCREDSALKYTVSSLFDPINKVESALSVVVCYTYHMPTTDSDGKDMMWCDKKTLIFKNTTPLIDSLKWNDLWVMKVTSYNFSCSEKKIWMSLDSWPPNNPCSPATNWGISMDSVS